MKRLTRSASDSWLGGVCGGLGRYFGVDPNLIRLATVLLTIFGFGTVIIAYVLAWILMPREVVSYGPPTPPQTD